MGEKIIWILSGAVLFLMVFCIYAVWESRRSIKRIQAAVGEKEETKAQIEALTREKELLEVQLEEAKKNNEKNQRLAYYDTTTGLPNELTLTEILDGTVKTLRKDETLSLIYIDLEHLDGPDGQMSYVYKDEFLVDVTDRLKQALDENDLLACVSGDRFVILTQNISSTEEIEEKVKRIQKIFSYPFVLAATEIFMNINMGICFGPKDGKTAQTLLKNLNTALFAAKHKGKNQYCYFEEELAKAMMNRIELQSQMRTGIDNNEFEVYYQPQVDMKTEKVRGFEALLRWKHPTRGLLLPDSFLPIAEDTGLIVPIGKWVIETACSQLKAWQEQGYHDLDVSVNLSLRQLREKQLVSEVKEIIEKTGVEKEHLLFEIPEQATIEEAELVVSRIQELEELGVKVSMDNFGMGLCYLEHMEKMPIHAFKIDRTFVEKEDSRSMPVLMALAKAHGAELVAGGVENEAQKKLLSETGCKWVQGFLYSEPVTKEEAENFLKW